MTSIILILTSAVQPGAGLRAQHMKGSYKIPIPFAKKSTKWGEFTTRLSSSESPQNGHLDF